MEFEIWSYVIIFVVGFFAGVINTVSAGGSLLTLPMLIFLGLPSAEANGTNRVAIVVQSISAVMAFKKKGKLETKVSSLVALPAIIGSIFGAMAAVSISDALFQIILAITMIVTIVFIIWDPSQRTGAGIPLTAQRKVVGMLLFFAIGFYGGFIQVGAGFYIVLTAILIMQLSFIHANSVKVLLSGLYVLASLVVFGLNGEVNWWIGLVLALGNATGAWLGSNIIMSSQTRWIKGILLITVIVMAIRLLYEAFI